MSRHLKMLFTASVLLNVLLVGAFGGFVVSRIMDRPWHEVKKELSPESQHVVARTMQEAFKEARPKMREARQSKRKLMRILKADEFDAEAFERVAEDMAKLNGEMMESRIAVTKELASQLPAEERAVLAKRFTEGFSSGGRKMREQAAKRERKPLHPFLNSMDIIGPQRPEKQPSETDN